MVTYQDAMQLLSQCGFGALVLSDAGIVLSMNEAGRALFRADADIVGKRLADFAAPLCETPEKPVYVNVSFGEYLTRCPTPQVSGLPAGAQLLVFRDATEDACHDMLISVLNQVSEAVVLCDTEGRMYFLNDAAVRLDSMVNRDILGENVTSVYQMRNGQDFMIPRVIREKRAYLNHRQHYTTRYGKDVDAVSNTFPIVQNGQVLGGFNILKDWSAIDGLHKQIIDLQEKLIALTSGKHKSKSALTAQYTFKDIIYISPGMHNVVSQCRQIAQSDSSVMIYGETGTGKELFAQSIHNDSRRADGPFLAINCAALPENLLEGLLFGTEKGAYTGAETRMGLFEQADGGTLLLDEINSMNVTLQAKLLRVLQDGVIRRIGGSSEIRVDVRVLSNINIPPQQAIAENKLRRDLYYRLGVVNITIPPLRERQEDISLLAKHFIMRYNKKLRKNIRNLETDALELFHTYRWPGNVRELQHAIEHAMNVLPDDLSSIPPACLPEHILTAQVEPLPKQRPVLQPDIPLNYTIHNMERSAICEVLRECGGNISKAAAILKMSRQNLQYRIKRYQIDITKLIR